MLVIGASSGSSGSRALLTRIASPHRTPLAVRRTRVGHASREGAAVLDALDSVYKSAAELGSTATHSAVACRPGSNYSVFAGRHGNSASVAVDEVDAQIRYARYVGAFPNHGSAVICDVGSSGTTMSLVDLASSSTVHTRRTTALSGNDFDYSVKRHLATHGVSTDVDTIRTVKLRLTREGVVTVRDSYSGVRCVVTRRDFDTLITSAVRHCATLLAQLISLSRLMPSTMIVVGGGGNIRFIHRVLSDATGIAVTPLPTPELVSARGAALLSALPRVADPYLLASFG